LQRENKYTPSDRQMYPKVHIYPRLGTPALDQRCTTCGLW